MRKNKTVSDQDRARICNSYSEGNTVAEISRVMGIKATTVHEIIKSFLRRCDHKALKRGGTRNRKLNQFVIETIKSWIDTDYSLSCSKNSDRLRTEFQISVVNSTISRAISGFNYSFKQIHNIPERRNNKINKYQKVVCNGIHIVTNKVFGGTVDLH
jgi:transposase